MSMGTHNIDYQPCMDFFNHPQLYLYNYHIVYIVYKIIIVEVMHYAALTTAARMQTKMKVTKTSRRQRTYREYTGDVLPIQTAKCNRSKLTQLVFITTNILHI